MLKLICRVVSSSAIARAVGQGPGQAVELGHHQGVAGPVVPRDAVGSGIEQCPTPPARAYEATTARAAAGRNGIGNRSRFGYGSSGGRALTVARVTEMWSPSRRR